MATSSPFLASTTTQLKASFGLLFARFTIGLTLSFYIVNNFNSAYGFSGHAALGCGVAFIVLCAACVMLGIVSRPAAMLLVLIILCFNRALFHNDTIHPWLELFILYTAFYTLILIVGPGRFSLDRFLFGRAENARY